MNQSGHQIQCFRCRQWGHKKADCPNKSDIKKQIRPPLPPQSEAFNNRNKKPPQAKAQARPLNVKINYISVKIEGEEQAQIYVAFDPSGHNCQFIVLEAEGEYEGNSLTILIDLGSSHSFISPSIAKKLGLNAQPTGKKLRASLANGSSILAYEQVLTISFQLSGNPTTQEFRILKMGKFQGILGMDWLGKNKAQINCGLGSILFTSDLKA